MGIEVFPELNDELSRVKGLKHVLFSGHDPLVISSLQHEAMQVVNEGCLEVDFAFGEGDKLPAGRYTIPLTQQEATEWMAAAVSFLTQPRKYSTFAEALSPELEALMCGHRPDRYHMVPPQM